MFAEKPLKPEPVARAELHHYLNDFDARADGIPKRIDPALVVRFLREDLAKGRPGPARAGRMVTLADFYHATDLVVDFAKQLEGKEANDQEFAASMQFVRGLSLLGDDKHRDVAVENYNRLLVQSHVEARSHDVLAAASDLPWKRIGEPTTKRLDQIAAALKQRGEADPGAATDARRFEEVRTNELPRIGAAAIIKEEIIGKADRAERLDKLIDIYLDVDLRHHAYMRDWAVRMIQREARTGGNAPVADAFRRAAGRVGPKADDDETGKARRNRALLGVDFFGGALQPGEAPINPPSQRFYNTLADDDPPK